MPFSPLPNSDDRLTLSTLHGRVTITRSGVDGNVDGYDVTVDGMSDIRAYDTLKQAVRAALDYLGLAAAAKTAS